MKLNQGQEAFMGFNALVLFVGVALVLIVIILGYREYRVRQHKKREATTRLMIGSFNLYNPVDRLKANSLISDLYQIYIESYKECGQPLENTPELFDQFVEDFAYPYITGKVDLSKLPLDVAKAFRKKHYEYVSQHRPA